MTLCHECGRWLTALGVHIGMIHDGGVRAYRLRHGLTMSTRLAAESLRQNLAEHATRRDYAARLAATRQPEEARRSADPEVTARGARLTRLRDQP